jgi:hypothetical protein
MRNLDQERVQKAIDRAYDAEVANLFKTFLEDVIEATTGTTGSDFSKADQCVGAFARSMKRAAFAYDKACEVAKQVVIADSRAS